jgi:putative Mg2+ transporter-C (MgtC) family protein
MTIGKASVKWEEPIMPSIWEDMFSGFDNTQHMGKIIARLVTAVLLGGIVGYERLRERKAAGLRTHMLVSLGSCLFTLVALETEMQNQDLSRVIQGIATGVGFLGAGTILKLSEQHKIEGLTSAATIWMTAAVGMTVGVGWLWPAILAVVLAWAILSTMHSLERRLRPKEGENKP